MKNSHVQELTAKEFDAFYKQGVVLIDFFADWCMPCTMMSPIVEELGEKFKGKVKIGKVNISDNESVAMKYGVNSIPTFIIFKNGKIAKQFTGMTSYEEFCDILDEFIR